ncbi:MAG: hypothetical protein IH940_10900 [Acidobacteria bacterium]|nr:hypothetical protein [Acidobacteriota bacterium]
MTTEILRPDGETGAAPVQLAAPLASLAGVTIGLLDNTKPNAGVLLDRLGATLAARTGARLGRRETKNAAVAASDQVLESMTEEVRVVLTGSAD